MTKDNLHKLLEDCWDECLNTVQRQNSSGCEIDLYGAAGAYITSQLSAMEQVEGTKWVKASERLPEVSEGHAHEVIINSHINKAQEQDVVVCGIFYNGNFYICSEWNGEYPDDVEPIKKGRISHWQELPPPHSSSESPSDGQDWISVEDRLPKLTEPLMGYNDENIMEVFIPNFQVTVLGFNEEIGVFKARRTASGWAEIGTHYVNGTVKPTHWQPLPEPPKIN